VAKTRMQTASLAKGEAAPSLRATLAMMLREGGVVRGLFMPGLTASMLREMLSSGPRAGFYVPVRDFFAAQLPSSGDGSGDGGALVKIAAAMTTGVLGGLIANPIDVVKIRLMRDPGSYPSTLGALPAIARLEGLKGLYRGLAPSTLRACFIAAGEVAAYDISKTNLRLALSSQAGAGIDEGFALHVGASLITGVIAAFVAAPFDLIKTRAMASSTDSSIVRIVAQLVREGGFPLSLFRGVVPAYLRLGPHALICFPLLEQTRALFGLGYI